MSIEEIKKVMAIPDVSDSLGLRDRAILETFYASGVRRSELVNLDFDDLDISLGILKIRRGKGEKDRVVPVGKNALEWLRKYLDKPRPLLLVKGSERALFLSGYGERFSANYIGNWVRKTIEKPTSATKEAVIYCGTLAQHTCSKAERIFVTFNKCLVIPTR